MNQIPLQTEPMSGSSAGSVPHSEQKTDSAPVIAPKAKLLPLADPTARRIYWMNRVQVTRQDGSTEELRPSPEVIAVAIAKCSRSDSPFDQNVDDVTLEKAAEFHEKWVVGYGHASVAEHATSSVAIENISQVAIKLLEDTRLASYTEKSSRYVVFSRARTYIPAAIQKSSVAQDFTQLLDHLYGLYEDLRGPVSALMKERFPKSPELTDKAYEAQTKARTLDVVRGLLPAASLTSLGMTCNARVWEMTISKLLSHPLEEARLVGEELRNILKGEKTLDPDKALAERPHPTLLKYADAKPYLQETMRDVTLLAHHILNKEDGTQAKRTQATAERPVVLVRDDEFAEARIAAALLARASHYSYAEIFERLKRDPQTCQRVLETALSKRGPHDQPLREFEHAQFQHEIVMDYGAWRDVQRHRMCTQTNQNLNIHLGYELPEEVKTVGHAEPFHTVMREAAHVYEKLLEAGLVHEAEYAVPMAYRRRLLVSWNLRELFHFIELRSGIKGHPSYRRIAQEVWRTIEHTHPFLAKFIRVDLRGNEAGVSTLGMKPKGI